MYKMADEAAAEEDEDEFSFEGFYEYLDGLIRILWKNQMRKRKC